MQAPILKEFLRRLQGKKWHQFRERGILAVLIALCLIFTIVAPVFRNPSNLINVVKQFSEISIMAIGMTFVIICAEIDLSVGSIYGLCSMLAASILTRGLPPILAVIVAIGSGIIIGFINGFLSTKARVPAFIVTLSMLAIARGATFGITNGMQISNFPDTHNWFFSIGDSLWGVIPVQVIIMIVLNIIAAIILTNTTFGFKVYATGGNKNAAKLSGINVDRIKIYSFIIMGALSAVAGLISLAYLQTVPATSGTGREMDVVAAVILGGTNLYGGKGTMLGTLIGAAIMGVVRNGMVLLGVPAFFQEAFIGIVILAAVLADIWIKKD